LIEELIVLELKSVAEIHQIHKAQTMNYMNLLKVPRSILVNFNVTNLYHEGSEYFASKIFKELPKNENHRFSNLSDLLYAASEITKVA
jgi:hypothetical protein